MAIHVSRMTTFKLIELQDFFLKTQRKVIINSAQIKKYIWLHKSQHSFFSWLNHDTLQINKRKTKKRTRLPVSGDF